MAGGMSSGRGVPLKDRPVVHGAGWPDQASDARADESEPVGRGRRRHCWVTLPDHEGEIEGMVLQWASEPGGWVALTIYVLEGAPGGPLSVQAWVPAARLRPA